MFKLIYRSVFGMLALLGLTAEAQTYPDRPVRLVVVNPPGGGVDVVARLVGRPLSEKWNQPVVVDNRSGASGMIAGAYVASSPPDGYTVLISASEAALNVALFPKMQYDPVKAFAPVTLIATTPMVLVTHPSLKIKTLKDFLSYVSARPGIVNYGSGGNGTPQHFAAELLKQITKTDMTHVPYKSGGLQVLALVAGEVSAGFAALLPALPHIRTGRLDAIAVSSLKRSPSLPDVPTLAESGYPSFDITQWYAAWVPAATSRTVVDKIAANIVEIANSDDFRKRMLDLGAESVGSTAEELGKFQIREIEKYRDIAAQANIKVD